MKKIEAYKKNRVCKFPNCNRTLSIYNREIYCYVHQRATAGQKSPPL